MRSKRIILLKTMLLSTSNINKIRYCDDSKKRNKAIGALVGMAFIYLMIIVYCLLISVGYGKMGIVNAIPAVCASMISIVAFIFTLFRTNGYLINFREYDMIMSLPFEVKNVVAVKFLYMYIKNTPWFLSISFAMLVGYAIYAKPLIIVYLLWLLLSLFVPIIPMLVASFIGFIIARISAGFKKTNLIQTVLMFAFVLFCFSIQFIINGITSENEINIVLNSILDKINSLGDIYLPLKWFRNAIADLRVLDIILLVATSLLLFEVVFVIIGKSYRRINSAMKNHAASKSFEFKKTKSNSVVMAVAFKEFKRLTGSTVYMVNIAIGEVLALILGVAVLIVGFDKVIAVVTNGAPIKTEIMYPAIPLIVYFLVGMVASTACSPSLEGKNYWIVKSLPIENKVLYQGKMLFNMFLTVPVAVFAIICLCISANVPAINYVIYIIETVALCGFSTTWGCVCGVKFMKLDWENEIEVIKQGAAVMLYLFPNMFVTMGLAVLSVYLGIKTDGNIVSAITTVVYLVLSIISYNIVISMARKQD